jgi:VanZ family protein
VDVAMMKHAFRMAGVLAVCLVVVLSVIPGHMQIRTEAPKAVEHFAAYFLTGLIVARALGSYCRAWVVIGVFMALAATLEVCQPWVPGRTFEVSDWAAGALGAIIGVALARAWERAAAKRALSSAADGPKNLHGAGGTSAARPSNPS